MTATTTMATRNINTSNVPLGTRNQPVAPSPRKPRPATDKSHITTRDNIGSKVVSSSPSKTAAGKASSKYSSGAALANRSGDGVAMALGKSTTSAATASASQGALPAAAASSSTTAPLSSGSARPPVTANKQFQMALKQQQSELLGVTGARRKRLAMGGQISSTAALGGCGTPPPQPVGGKSKAAGHSVSSTSNSGGLFAGLGASVSTSSSNGRNHRDPNDPRFAGAAGVPSGRIIGKATITTATGEGKPIPTTQLRKNASVAGAAGTRSEDRNKYADCAHKKRVNAVKPPGETHVNVLGGSSTVPVDTLLSSLAIVNNGDSSSAPPPPKTPELHTSKRLVPGRSNISPYRGGVSPMRSLSGAGRSFVSKPYATTEDTPISDASGGQDLNGTTTSGLGRSHSKRQLTAGGVHQTNQSSLVGVFKPDPTVIKPRAANNVAPWERNEQNHSVSAKGRSASTIGHAARQTHMDGVFTVPDAAVAATGASVGSSNVMARGNSPYRGGAAPSVTTRVVSAAVGQGTARATTPAATSTAPQRSSSASRRYAVTPSSTSTRPVWAMSPRTEEHRPGLGGTSCRRLATAAPAPWATD